MSRATLSLTIASLFLLGSGAAQAETAKVSSKIAELRVKPSGDARTKLKLGRNRTVDVLSKSDDGQWVKIRAEIQRGEDPVTFEGWIAAVDLGIKGATAPASSGSGSESGWGDEDSSASGSSDVASASDLDWATETPAAEPAPVESWETPAETESAPAADAWGSGGSDSDVPASSDSGSSAWGDDSGSSSDDSAAAESDW